MKVWVVIEPNDTGTPGFGRVAKVFGNAELAERWASMGDMEITEAEVCFAWEDAG